MSKKTFILKPEASCQGRGIFLCRSLDQVDPTHHYVAQKYCSNPLLIDGLKFDLRLYVLVYGIDPLRIYMFKEGLARFSTVKYQNPGNTNLDNLYMHLTNYSINKTNKQFK